MKNEKKSTRSKSHDTAVMETILLYDVTFDSGITRFNKNDNLLV